MTLKDVFLLSVKNFIFSFGLILCILVVFVWVNFLFCFVSFIYNCIVYYINHISLSVFILVNYFYQVFHIVLYQYLVESISFFHSELFLHYSFDMLVYSHYSVCFIKSLLSTFSSYMISFSFYSFSFSSYSTSVFFIMVNSYFLIFLYSIYS